MKKLLLPLFSVTFIGISSLLAQAIDYDKLAPHPRILLKSGDVTAMKEYVEKSSNAKAVHNFIITEADKMLSSAPVERVMTGRRLLSISRTALKRIFYLSYAYVTTEDKRYAARAEQEMLALSKFSDWNPSHFLDVGEATLAMAKG